MNGGAGSTVSSAVVGTPSGWYVILPGVLDFTRRSLVDVGTGLVTIGMNGVKGSFRASQISFEERGG